MQKFEYVALNQKEVELSGVVFADNKDQANQKIQNMGLEIIKLEATEKKINNKELQNYKFEGIQNSQHVDGTIQASSFNHALLELTDRYQMQVEKLAFQDATESEFNESIHKINSFLKRLDFYSEKPNAKTKNNSEEIFLFLESLIEDFSHYFTETGLSEINQLKNQFIQIKNTNNKKQKIKFLNLVLNKLLEAKIYKKSSSKSGLEYIYKETLNIFHKIGQKNSISFTFKKLAILLQTKSEVIRNLIVKEVFDINTTINFNFKEYLEDLESIGFIGTIIFFSAIFFVNLGLLKIQIPSIWYKVGIFFFSVYSTFTLNNLLNKFDIKNKILLTINLLNLFFLIKI